MKQIFDIDDHARLPWRFFSVMQNMRCYYQKN